MTGDWAQGYVTDVLYTESFFRELSPSWLNYVAAMHGCHPRPLERPFAYLELGCGMGQSMATLAGAFPKGEFVGVDFNPGHVDAGRRYAEEAGLGNAAYIEASFQDLASGQHALPECDFIVLHGVYTWISLEARLAVQKVIRDRLKPGGIVYNSYNCLPGWAPDAPIRKLMYEWAAALPGDPGTKAAPALKFLKDMADAKLGYFQGAPSAAKLVEKFLTRDPNYLAHEFLNADWKLFFSTDVADDMANSKLTYMGSATLAENHIELLMNDEMVKKINEQPTPRLKQLVQDYAISQRFRRDVFVRGHPHLNRAAMLRHLNAIPFTLAKAKVETGEAVKVPRGEIRFDQKIFPDLVELLDGGVVTMNELRREVAKRTKQAQDIDRTILLLNASGIAQPCAKPYTAGPMPGKITRIDLKSKINKLLLAKAVELAGRCHLVSEWGGTGVSFGPLESIVLGQICVGWESEDAMVAKLAAEYKRRNIRLNPPPETPAKDKDGKEKDSKAGDSKAEDAKAETPRAETSKAGNGKEPADAKEAKDAKNKAPPTPESAAREHLAKFLKEQVPILHRLGIVLVA